MGRPPLPLETILQGKALSSGDACHRGRGWEVDLRCLPCKERGVGGRLLRVC